MYRNCTPTECYSMYLGTDNVRMQTTPAKSHHHSLTHAIQGTDDRGQQSQCPHSKLLGVYTLQHERCNECVRDGSAAIENSPQIIGASISESRADELHGHFFCIGVGRGSGLRETTLTIM